MFRGSFGELRLLRRGGGGGRRLSAAAAAAEGEGEEEEEGGRGGGRFRFYKSRGQHILANPQTLDAIVDRAELLEEDTVLEIGPGTGNLTLKLLRAARRVVAVEIDPRMVDALHRRVSRHGLSAKLQIVSGDALRTEFPEFDLCVANIPYGISSPLLDKLLFSHARARRRFRSATLLLQKEFARRLVAKPGDSERSRLAMNVGLVADVELIMEVGRGNFVPPPKVDSSLVKIRPKPAIPEIDLNEWWALTRACFGQRRKTLGAIFKQKAVLQGLLKEGGEEEESGVDVLRQKTMSVLREGGLVNARAGTLSEEDVLGLLAMFHREGIRFHHP
ncbi:ribosomal RNA small subunit methyltransferase, mitochondrial-like [Wolffia australiana]